MQGIPAVYLGRIVEKKNFRVFIYGVNGERRLVNSWEEFEANMQSGIWFATVEDALASQAVVEDADEVITKPKSKRKPKSKPVSEEVEEVVMEDDGSVFEVTDDFLPSEGK
jgi:hypothetical protein